MTECNQMGKAKDKINNLQPYNQALVNRGSLVPSGWMMRPFISGTASLRGRGFQFSDNVIATALIQFLFTRVHNTS